MQITLVTYLVTFLVESFALSLVLAGLVMAVSQVASVIGRVLWGALADRAGVATSARRTVLGLLGIGMGVSALAALSAAPGWPRELLFLYAAIFGATAVGWNGVWLAEIARLAPGRATC